MNILFRYVLHTSILINSLNILSAASSEVQTYQNYKLLRISPKDVDENEYLLLKGQEFKIDFWSRPTPKLRPFIASLSPTNTSQQFFDSISQRKIQYQLLCQNLEELINKQNKKQKRFSNVEKESFNYDSAYHNLENITSELYRIGKVYANITSVFSIGKTSEDRDILAIYISTQDSMDRNTSIIVLECGVHAREWISTSMCLWSINKLVNGDSLLDNYEFVIIPVLNSDGYVYTWEKDRLWRKNRNKFNITFGNETCYGIDANRNWGTKNYCLYSSNYDPCDRELFCGESPFSAPEAKALRDFLIGKKDKLLAYFSIHSFSQLWMYPWGYQTDRNQDFEQFEKLSKIAVNALKKVHGTQYTYGSIANIIYPASGSSVDWIYDTLDVKISFAIELRDEGLHGFLLPPEYIKPTCEETWAAINAIFQYLNTGFQDNNFSQSQSLTSIAIDECLMETILAFHFISFTFT